jgi:hypothetical protein
MTTDTDYIIQSLFERESMDEMTLDELRGLNEQYPYSSVIQFLYTSKLKAIYHLDFPEAVTKTAIFFSDPFWLDYQLNDENERGNFKRSGYEFNVEESKENRAPSPQDQPIHDEPIFDEEGYELTDEIPSPPLQDLVEPEPEAIQENVISQDEATSLKTPDSIPPSLSFDIPIEPYHTVDYFASQGIKLNVIEEKSDLGEKVKSFTAWLKTLKRLQPVESQPHTIQSESEESAEVKEPAMESILTEAMADVYLKQGLKEKAIAVYQKLSLQNPANSHIFAAKISMIKENNV